MSSAARSYAIPTHDLFLDALTDQYVLRLMDVPARLPEPGHDEDVWGDILNNFLLVSHNDDGSLRSSALASDGVSLATTAYVDAATAGATAPDATSSVKGKVQLAGDLGGTANSPSVKNRLKVFNVEDYGAVGNGVADDLSAIQVAIDAASAIGGGTVQLAANTTYGISGSIQIRNNITFQGYGFGSVLYLLPGSNSGVITGYVSTGLSNVLLRDCTVDGNSSNQTGNSDPNNATVNLPGHNDILDNVVVDHIQVKNTWHHAIFIHGDPNHKLTKIIRNCTVTNYGVSDGASTGFGLYADFAPGTRFLYNTVTGGGDDAIEMVHGGQMVAIGNYVADGQIQFPFCDNAIIAFNICVNQTIQNDTHTANNVIITGNQILGATPGSGFGGISVYGANATITNNQVVVTASSGIIVVGDDCNISGNHIDGTSAAVGGAIGVYSNQSSNTKMYGNTIKNFAVAIQMVYDYNEAFLNTIVSCTNGVVLSSSATSGHAMVGTKTAMNSYANVTTPYNANGQGSDSRYTQNNGTLIVGNDTGSGVMSVQQPLSGSKDVLQLDNYGSGKTLQGKSAGTNTWNITNTGKMSLGDSGLLVLDGVSGTITNRVKNASDLSLLSTSKNNINHDNTASAAIIVSTSTVDDGTTYVKTNTVMELSSNAVQTSGTITDSSKVLTVTQSNAASTGDVVTISNAGTGYALNILSGLMRVSGRIVNVTDPTGLQDAATKNYVDSSISTATSVSGLMAPLTVGQGGSGTGTAFTAGSIVFAGASGVYSQDNSSLFFDDANNRFGLLTAAPSDTLTLGSLSTGIALHNQADQTTNFEVGRLYWNANVFTLGTLKGGTGVNRSVTIASGATVTLAAGAVSFSIVDSTVKSTLNFGSTGSGTTALLVTGTFTGSSITQSALALTPTYNQTSTAGSTDIKVNRIETALGGGVHKFVDFQVGGNSKYSVDNKGQLAAAGLTLAIVAKSSAYTAGPADSTILVSGTTTITLPTAVGIAGRIYTIKKTDTGTTSAVATTSSQTIDGATTYVLTAQYKYAVVQSDGANWLIIGNN